MRVLVATDLTEAADSAMREAASIVAAYGGELAVVHVVPSLQIVDAFSRRTRSSARAAVRRRIDDVLGAAPDLFVDAGIAHAEIVRRAARWRADLLVLGSHGRRRPARARVFRSVAERVVGAAPCNVLVARPSASRGWVLAECDFSEAAPATIRWGAKEADRRGARLDVVHALGFLELEARYVLAPAPLLASGDTVRDLAARSLVETVSAAGAEAECELLEGGAAAALVAHARAIGAELVVLAHGGRGLARVYDRSVARRVVRGAPCSVLAVAATA